MTDHEHLSFGLEDLANPEKVSELLTGMKWGSGGDRPQVNTLVELPLVMTQLPDILEVSTTPSADPPVLNRSVMPTEFAVGNNLCDIAADALIGAAKLLIALRKDTPLTETDRDKFEAGIMHQFGALVDETFILGSIQQERKNLIAGMFTNN